MIGGENVFSWRLLQKGQTYREEVKPTKNFENCEGSSQDS
jgi:hypothetical protein